MFLLKIFVQESPKSIPHSHAFALQIHGMFKIFIWFLEHFSRISRRSSHKDLYIMVKIFIHTGLSENLMAFTRSFCQRTSYKWPFSIAMLVYQRVIHEKRNNFFFACSAFWSQNYDRISRGNKRKYLGKKTQMPVHQDTHAHFLVQMSIKSRNMSEGA